MDQRPSAFEIAASEIAETELASNPGSPTEWPTDLDEDTLKKVDLETLWFGGTGPGGDVTSSSTLTAGSSTRTGSSSTAAATTSQPGSCSFGGQASQAAAQPKRERKRNRKEMDEDPSFDWKSCGFVSHRRYEKEILGKNKGRGGKKRKDK